MNIKTVGFAFMVVAATSGCASTMDTDTQKTIEGTETVQAADTVQATGSESYDPDEVTCKKVTKTGTRFKTKVCATNAEWKASAEYAENVVEEMQSRPQYGRDER